MLLACRRLAFSSRRLSTASSDHFSLLSLQRRFDLDEAELQAALELGDELVGDAPVERALHEGDRVEVVREERRDGGREILGPRSHCHNRARARGVALSVTRLC